MGIQKYVYLAVLQTPVFPFKPQKEVYFFLGHPVSREYLGHISCISETYFEANEIKFWAYTLYIWSWKYYLMDILGNFQVYFSFISGAYEACWKYNLVYPGSRPRYLAHIMGINYAKLKHNVWHISKVSHKYLRYMYCKHQVYFRHITDTPRIYPKHVSDISLAYSRLIKAYHRYVLKEEI